MIEPDLSPSPLAGEGLGRGRRDRYLSAQGFTVLRFWNNGICNNEEGVLERILDALKAPLPNPSPAEGRGL